MRMLKILDLIGWDEAYRFRGGMAFLCLVSLYFSLPLKAVELSAAELTDGTITIELSGAAVTSWASGYEHHNCAASKWADSGGVVLGESYHGSMPTYSFLLPPPRMAPGVRELLELEISLYGKGAWLSGTKIYIGGQDRGKLDNDEGWNIYNYTGSEARGLLVDANDGVGYRLDITLDATNINDWYDLKEVKLSYKYSGLDTILLASFHEVYGGYQTLSTFKAYVIDELWDRTAHDAEQIYLFNQKCISVALNFSSVDSPFLLSSLISGVSYLRGIQELLDDIQGALGRLFLWVKYDEHGGVDQGDLSDHLYAAAVQMKELALVWLNSMNDGAISEAEKHQIDEHISHSIEKLEIVRGNLELARKGLAGAYTSTFPEGIDKEAEIMFLSLLPLMHYSHGPHGWRAQDDSYLPLLIKTLQERRFYREGGYLSISGDKWDDPNGDDDGVMEAGEMVRLKVQLGSTGSVRDVDAVLRTSDSKVNITDSTVYYQPFSADELQWSVGWFDMDLNFELSEGQTRTSHFTLHLTYEEDGLDYCQDISFNKEFSWPGDHVWFEISDCTIDDAPTICHRNNGDSIFQSSEEIHIRPLLCNKGTANASRIDVSVIYDGKVLLDVGQNDRRYPDLAPGDCGYPENNRYFRICSTDYSFTGTVNLDVHVICDERSTPQVIKNAIQLQVEPVPVLSVSPEKYGFGVTRCGKDVTTDIMRVRNAGSGVMTVSDVRTSHDDTVVPEADKSFTLAPGTERNIRITIHTDNIPNGTTISREVRIISDGRIADMTPPSDRMIITGLVGDEIPIFRVPGVTQGEYPDISGSWIVWQDSRNGNLDIYAYDISTGTEHQITTNSSDQEKPRISGKLIAWQDYRNWDGTGGGSADIYGYDLSTHKEFVISDDPAHEQLIGVDNDTVAFTRVYYVFTEQSNGNDVSNLWLYDHSTGIDTNVTGFTSNTSHNPMHTVSAWDADFGGGLLVWQEYTMYWETQYKNAYWTGTDSRVLAMGVGLAPVQVLTGWYYPRSADMDRFVWVKEDDNHDQIWIWDNGSVRQVTTEETDHREDGLAVGRDFIIYDKKSAPGLFYWDLNEDREFLLTEQLSRSEAARMDANCVVLSSLVDSEWQIYYASLDGSFPGGCPQLTIDPGSLSPANGSAGPRRITFDWEAVLNTAGYAFQIDTVDAAFNHLWCDEEIFGSQVTKTIPPVDSIYWRVKALGSGACSDGPWTSPLVYISERPPEPPSNLQAFDTPNDQGHSITLTWTKSPDDGAGLNIVSYYRIYRSRSSELTDPIPISSFLWSACPDTFEFAPGSCPALDSLIVVELDHTILIDSVAAGVTKYVDSFVPVTGVPYTYWLDAVAANGGMSAKIVAQILPTGVSEEATASLPKEYFLYQNYPNPFNPETTIRYALPSEGRVTLTVYNAMGQRICILVEGEQTAGYHRAVWDGTDDTGRDVASGVYLCRMEAGDYSAVRKLVLVR